MSLPCNPMATVRLRLRFYSGDSRARFHSASGRQALLHCHGRQSAQKKNIPQLCCSRHERASRFNKETTHSCLASARVPEKKALPEGAEPAAVTSTQPEVKQQSGYLQTHLCVGRGAFPKPHHRWIPKSACKRTFIYFYTHT